MFKHKKLLSFIFTDALAVIIFVLNSSSIIDIITFSSIFLSLLIILPVLIILYAFTGTYEQITRKSRFKELLRTLNQSLLIVFIYFFIAHYIDQTSVYEGGYVKFLKVGFSHFFILYLARLFFLTWVKKQIQAGKISFNTIIIGNNKKANDILKEIESQSKRIGFKFLGYIETDDQKENQDLPIAKLGEFEDIVTIIKSYAIEEVIVAIETNQHHKLKSILDELEKTDVIINIIPDSYDIVSGFVKLNYLFSVPLITLHPDNMPFWQKSIKVLIDYTCAVAVLILLSPVFLLIFLLIKLDSKGPGIYKQERIGKNGIPFYIYKFRSMHVHAEEKGPMLSKANDPRVTKVGRILRKTRLDELPQFFNILKGNMSLVGPRPEREFYIKQIVSRAPHYHYLHKVLPGITSWGQVKFGYAENIDQMVNRLTFDIIYVENRSLALDLKIIVYTILIVLQRRGK